MVRIFSQVPRPASAGPGPATARHREQVRGANGIKPAYKIVVEETWRPRKKLITSTYAEKEPPPGYTFVPAGDPQLTTQCKELARQDGARIYVVSTTKHQDTQLSMEVHRIGYHIPSTIVERACTSLGLRLDRHGNVVRPPALQQVEKPKGHPHRKGFGRIDKKALKNMQQKEVDREARQAILDLFPAIPKEDLDVIVDRAFDLGSKKVGTQVSDLSLPRRVQLAVVAHIRHVYTDYDNVLKQVPWLKARGMVEQACLEKLALWRGDEQEDPNAMEEILQEVIVIPDDENIDDIQDTEIRNNLLSNTDGLIQRSDPQPQVQVISPNSREHEHFKELPRENRAYAPRTHTQAWTERARVHQEEAWRQAMNRVRRPEFQGNIIPQSIRPTQPDIFLERSPRQFRPIYESYVRPAVNLNRIQVEAPQSHGHERSRTLDFEGTNQLAIAGSSQNRLHDRLDASYEHGNFFLRSHDRAVRETASSGATPVDYVSPEEPLPSVEPITPRQARRFEFAETARSPRVVYVDYSNIEHDRPLKRYRSVDDGFPKTVAEVNRPGYQPPLTRSKAQASHHAPEPDAFARGSLNVYSPASGVMYHRQEERWGPNEPYRGEQRPITIIRDRPEQQEYAPFESSRRVVMVPYPEPSRHSGVGQAFSAGASRGALGNAEAAPPSPSYRGGRPPRIDPHVSHPLPGPGLASSSVPRPSADGPVFVRYISSHDERAPELPRHHGAPSRR